MLNAAVDTPEKGAFGKMLGFETLTLCPIDMSCIERGMLNTDEINWINQYHATVLERLSPLLQGDALDWLQRRTQIVV